MSAQQGIMQSAIQLLGGLMAVDGRQLLSLNMTHDWTACQVKLHDQNSLAGVCIMWAA